MAIGSLNNAVTIARSAILTHQKRLAVTSNNIANVNTPGYHRQIATLGTTPESKPTMLETRRNSTGSGVTLLNVVRAYNSMKESILRDSLSDESGHASRAAALTDVEAMLNGLGNTSLAGQLQKFWSAWQDLSAQPDSLAARSVLIEKGAALADQFRFLDNQLSGYRDQIAAGPVGGPFTGTIPTTVDQINAMATELQDLNYRITYSLSHYSPHALQDRRDALLRTLSETVKISVGSDFSVSIDGQLLVNGDGSTRNDLSLTDAGSPMTLELDGAGVNPASGKLAAWLDAAATVDSVRNNLDTLAQNLLQSVNTIHNSDLSTSGDAYDLDGNRSMLDFFTGTGASDITVNSLIHDRSNPLNDDPRRIAAAGSRYSAGPPPIPNPGDGNKALEIAELASANLAGLGGQNMGDYFINMLTVLGSAIESDRQSAEDSAAIISMIQDAIQQASGVNLDEEMIDMMSAQRAYQAAMRLFSTVDSMLEQILYGLKA